MNRNPKKLLLILFTAITLGFTACDDDEDVKNLLVVNDFISGKFYTIEKETGAVTEIFTVKYDNNDFINLRAFVYHRGENKFYAATNREGGADLYVINPETREAELITENSGGNATRTVIDGWSSIADLAVSEDDSLYATVYYDTDQAAGGFLKFGVDGNHAEKGIDAEGGICCGMGMILDQKNNEVIVANGWDQSNDGTIDIEVFDANSGESKSLTTIDTFEGFSEDFSTNYIAIRTMIRDQDGKIFAILYDAYDDFSYFVTVDLTAEKITRVATLSENSDAQFTGLAFVPENLTK